MTGRVDTAEGRLKNLRAAIQDADRECGFDVGPGHDRWLQAFLPALERHGLEVVESDGLLAAAEELDACRRDLADAHRKHGPDDDCEVCELAAELAEERTLHQATLRDLAEERARTTRLTEALERLASMEGFEGPGYVGGDSFAERELRARGFYAERMLAECGAGTEQPA